MNCDFLEHFFWINLNRLGMQAGILPFMQAKPQGQKVSGKPYRNLGQSVSGMASKLFMIQS